jgi:hypothetical protein
VGERGVHKAGVDGAARFSAERGVVGAGLGTAGAPGRGFVRRGAAQ